MPLTMTLAREEDVQHDIFPCGDSVLQNPRVERYPAEDLPGPQVWDPEVHTHVYQPYVYPRRSRHASCVPPPPGGSIQG
eukprot:jgi/Botrbrau1/20609/Bobra.113_1s0035.1